MIYTDDIIFIIPISDLSTINASVSGESASLFDCDSTIAIFTSSTGFNVTSSYYTSQSVDCFYLDEVSAIDYGTLNYTISSSYSFSQTGSLYNCNLYLPKYSFSLVTSSGNTCNLFGVRNAVWGRKFYLPYYDLGWSCDYSFIQPKQSTVSGMWYPDFYSLANLKLIKKYSYSWNLLQSEQIDYIRNMLDMMKCNKPILMGRLDGEWKWVMIDGDSVSLVQDEFDLWSLQLSLVEII